jgi:uncharacterized protein
MTARHSEDEYFAQRDIEAKRTLAQKKRAELADAEHARLKAAHWMRCAKCGMELEEIVFKGVRIDKCFHCGGSYLDNGELEKLCGSESHLLEHIRDVFKF